jgi:hypothetical protein
MNTPADPVKAWLAQFLFERGHFKGPTGQPLYQYQVEAVEYAALADLLKRHRDRQRHPLYGKSWASAFCLYVAERFRRDYDGGDEGWSWIPIERALDCSLGSQASRTELVQEGLAYWKRPIRKYEDSQQRSWLGSLALEGGLPWPLVQSDTHGFGRAVRRGLKYHYRTEGGRISTSDLIADVEDTLPKVFRNLDTRHLLAGIVEQLMALVKRHQLTNVADPAAYLDGCEERWREAFPIPLDENNARTLINDWLRDADKSNRERAEALARERHFACAHQLIGGPDDWHIHTEVTLPLEEVLPVDAAKLRGTRLAVTFHEGEALVGRGRTAYARLEGDKLTVPFAVPTVALERRNLAEPISLRLSESGQVIHSYTFDGSQFDLAEMPLVFEHRGEQWWLAATASCRLASPVLRVRLPPSGRVEGTDIRECGEDRHSGRWVETSGDLVIHVGSERYNVYLRSERSLLSQPQLKGDLCSYLSTPSTVYLGKPLLDVPADAGYGRNDLLEFENGRPAVVGGQHARAGTVRYTVRTREGETVLMRRFGLLPKGFRIQSLAASDRRPATLTLHGARDLECRVVGEGVSVQLQPQDDLLRIELSSNLPEPPPHVELELASRGTRDPVLIRIPYPLVGARLLDACGQVTDATAMTTDELLGTRLVLLSSRPQDFFLVFKLNTGGQRNIQRHYRVRVTDQPVSVALFDYLQDIRQMLGCVSEQHATVRLQVETDREWRRLDIGRYRGYLDAAGSTGLLIRDAGGIDAGADVEAMSILDPSRNPIPVPERLSEGVKTGVFVPPTELEQDGPWILCPSRRSQVRFAPKLYPGANPGTEELSPLLMAVRDFRPDRNPLAIDPHVADMAIDQDSSGWQYLHELGKRFDHLPLSTFGVWLALARNEAALAVALIRLELDLETCHRMRDELAVIWESIPLRAWVQAFQRSRTRLQEQGLPDQYAATFLEQLMAVLKALVPSLERVADLIRDGSMEALSRTHWVIVEHLLKSDYEKLRRNHSDDDRWPEDLTPQLTDWVARQKVLPETMAQLANVDYARAVTYLPVFMAFVTAGKAKISDLNGPPILVKFALRKLAEFDWPGWYLPVHELVLAYLVAHDGTKA